MSLRVPLGIGDRFFSSVGIRARRLSPATPAAQGSPSLLLASAPCPRIPVATTDPLRAVPTPRAGVRAVGQSLGRRQGYSPSAVRLSSKAAKSTFLLLLQRGKHL